MKKLFLSLLFSLLLFGQASAQVTAVQDRTGRQVFPWKVIHNCTQTFTNGIATLNCDYITSYTVATLPTAGVGTVVVVTDGVSGTDCTTGGGTALSLCRKGTTTWATLGGGGPTLAADCSTYIAQGQFCQDTGDGKVYVGTGVAAAELTIGSSGDMTKAEYDAGDTGYIDLAAGGTGTALVAPVGHHLIGWDDTENLVKWWVLGTGLTYTNATDTISLSHLGIEALTDPADHHLVGWDENENVTKWWVLGTGLTYTHGTDTLSVDTTAIQAYDADLKAIGDLVVAENKFLIGSAAPAWSLATYTMPTTITAGDILYASADNVVDVLPKDGAYKILAMNAGNTAPEYQSFVTGDIAGFTAGGYVPISDGAGKLVNSTNITLGNGLVNLGGAAGLKLTGSAGTIAFADLGGTTEALTLDLRTANTAKFTTSTGVTGIEFGIATAGIPITVMKTTGQAGAVGLYEANGDDTYQLFWEGPASIAESVSYKLSSLQPTANQVMLFDAPAGASGPGGSKQSAQTWGTPVLKNTVIDTDGLILATGDINAAGEMGYSTGFVFYGNGDDLKIYPGSSARNVTVSSSTAVTDVSFSALNLATTGTIQGGIKISSDADGMDAAAMTAAGMYGTMFIATGAGTWILPRAVLGMSACLMDSGTAHDLILDVTAGSTIRLKGTEQADAVGITNATGATTGDFICVIAVATDKWSTVGMQGTWTSQ